MEQRINSDKLKILDNINHDMVHVEGGTFTMGEEGYDSLDNKMIDSADPETFVITHMFGRNARDKNYIFNGHRIVGKTETEAWDSIWKKLRGEFELNSCNKCGMIDSTYELVWITAEDFKPKKKENNNS